MTARLTGAALALTVVAASAASSSAGGLARPNALSARSTGMGGAYSAVADDPTALHFNPAGLSFGAAGTLFVSVEALAATREYTPTFADDTCAGGSPPELCEVQSTENGIAPAPALGYSYRPTINGVPSRLTLAIGAWTTLGGAVEFPAFDNDDIAAFESSTSVAFELTPGFAYEVNDKLSIGGALRVSLGVVDFVSQKQPIDSDLSGIGLGVGANVGIMLKPGAGLSIGAVYRTSTTNNIDGEGDFDFGSGPQTTSFDFEQVWPQSAGLGVAYRATDSLLVSAQLDWTNWSRLNELRFEFPAADLPTQVVSLDWNDNIIARVGAELGVSERVVARLGAGYDSRVTPDRTTDRALADGDALFGTAGVSVAIADRWTLDGSIEVVQTLDIDVPDNRDELGDVIFRPPGSISPATAANPAPGTHAGRSLGLTVGFRYRL